MFIIIIATFNPRSSKNISRVVMLQVQLQNLITSKFIAHFLEEVSAWQTKLCHADQVITMWFEVQRTWTHLESIFMSSEDINMQLPEDSQRFNRIDADFKVRTKLHNITILCVLKICLLELKNQ
jgi:hypothetical protein